MSNPKSVRTKTMAHKNSNKRDRASSSGPNQGNNDDLPSNFFWDASFRKKIDGEKDRQISLGLTLPRGFLNTNRFENLYECFKFQDWGDFLEEFCEFEPPLIRLFYANLRPVSNSSSEYESIAYGKRIKISAGEFFDYFFSGYDPETFDVAELTGTNFSNFYPNYSYATALKSMLDPECNDFTSNSVVDLTLENRLLHHILTRTIIPRSGTFSTHTPFDIGVMFLIKSRVKINLANLMFYHMIKCASLAISHFPYGMHLTMFLLNYKKIASVPRNIVKPNPKVSVYDEKALRLLFKYNETTFHWNRKFPVHHLENSSVPIFPNMNEVPISFNEPQSSSQSSHSIDELYDLCASNFKSLGERVTHIENCQVLMSANLKDLTRQFQDIYGFHGDQHDDDSPPTF